MPKGSSRAAPQDTDPFFKKTIDFHYRGHSLRFRASQSLFSSHEIDRGTRLLLRTLDDIELPTGAKILDLGSGYGVLGLSLAEMYGASVHLVDRDALAVQYSRDNARLNKIEGANAYGSLGFDDVTESDFDLIVSNLPGKAGEKVLASLLTDAQHFLKPGGIVASVVVSTLDKVIASILQDSPKVAIVAHTTSKNHSVFHYTFKEDIGQQEFRPALHRDVYDRSRASLSLPKADHELKTARGVPEFDTLSYQTKLLIEMLTKHSGKKINVATVINPGQGHLAVAVHGLYDPDHLTLVDRDLLALRYSLKNVSVYAHPFDQVHLIHSPKFDGVQGNTSDLIVLTLRGDEPSAVTSSQLDGSLDSLSLDGISIVGGSSTRVTRIEKLVRLRKTVQIISRKRRKGSSVLVLRNE